MILGTCHILTLINKLTLVKNIKYKDRNAATIAFVIINMNHGNWKHSGQVKFQKPQLNLSCNQTSESFEGDFLSEKPKIDANLTESQDEICFQKHASKNRLSFRYQWLKGNNYAKIFGKLRSYLDFR